MCKRIVQYQVRVVLGSGKRESGENPERTGHCIQGVNFSNHCIPKECEKVKGTANCKSGNLPGTWMCSRHSASIRQS